MTNELIPYHVGRIVEGNCSLLEVAVQVLISCPPMNEYFRTLRSGYKNPLDNYVHVLVKRSIKNRGESDGRIFSKVVSKYIREHEGWNKQERNSVDYLFVLLDILRTDELEAIYTRTVKLVDICPLCGTVQHPPCQTRDRVDVYDIRSDLDIQSSIQSGAAPARATCVCGTVMRRSRDIKKISQVILIIVHRTTAEDLATPMVLSDSITLTDATQCDGKPVQYEYRATARIYRINQTCYYDCLRYDAETQHEVWVNNVPSHVYCDPKLHTLMVAYCLRPRPSMRLSLSTNSLTSVPTPPISPAESTSSTVSSILSPSILSPSNVSAAQTNDCQPRRFTFK